jgi:O-acetylserine/cysteine efflux transporter
VPGRHVALAVAVAVVWGVNFVVIHVGLDSFPPLLFAALRFALMAFPAVLFVRRPPVPARLVLGVGLFIGVGQFGLLFVAMDQGMPAGLASLVLQLQAVFTTVFAVILLGERPRRRQLAGMAVALAGIAVIGAGRAEAVPLLAVALCVLAAASWGAGNVCTRLAQAPDAFALLVWSCLAAPVPLALLSLIFEGPTAMGDALASVEVSGLLALAYLVVMATAFGYGVLDLAAQAPPRLDGGAVHADRAGRRDRVGLGGARRGADRRRVGRLGHHAGRARARGPRAPVASGGCRRPPSSSSATPSTPTWRRCSAAAMTPASRCARTSRATSAPGSPPASSSTGPSGSRPPRSTRPRACCAPAWGATCC